MTLVLAQDQRSAQTSQPVQDRASDISGAGSRVPARVAAIGEDGAMPDPTSAQASPQTAVEPAQSELWADVDRSGYYPELMSDSLRATLGTCLLYTSDAADEED